MSITPFGSRNYDAIPRLTTQRLILRAHRLEDLDPLARIWGDPKTTRFIGGKPRSRHDLWQQLQRTIGGWAMLGFGYWAIEDAASGKCVGELGFMEGLRDIEPPLTGTPEAGWLIAPTHWGRGFANEALTAAFQWRDVNIMSRRTVCIIEPEHAASIHIAQKHGFHKFAETSLSGDTIHIFERKT